MIFYSMIYLLVIKKLKFYQKPQPLHFIYAASLIIFFIANFYAMF